jgi:hypothetical protein
MAQRSTSSVHGGADERELHPAVVEEAGEGGEPVTRRNPCGRGGGGFELLYRWSRGSSAHSHCQ